MNEIDSLKDEIAKLQMEQTYIALNLSSMQAHVLFILISSSFSNNRSQFQEVAR